MLVGLLSHPEITEAAAGDKTGAKDAIEKLLLCHDKHGFGPPAALKVETSHFWKSTSKSHVDSSAQACIVPQRSSRESGLRRPRTLTEVAEFTHVHKCPCMQVQQGLLIMPISMQLVVLLTGLLLLSCYSNYRDI